MGKRTQKLFYKNTYLKTFTAKVLECRKQENCFSVILDRTAFYPEGGGQPSDIGVLNTVNVLDVQEKDGVIIHTTNRPLEPGMTVTGGIHWPNRFLLMQQHSGEHIVSGIVHKLFRLDNVGFHMGSKAVTVDFNGALNDDHMATVEFLANAAVFQNLPICAEYPSPEKLASMDYRSKKELSGDVRIVTVKDYDICACCGTHVARTGEIGAIKLLSSQRYKGGTRVTLLIGSRALGDYGEKAESVNKISALLSAKQEEVVAATERLLTENNLLKQQMIIMQNQLFELKASAVEENTKNICLFENDLGPIELRNFCLLLSEHCGGIAAVFSGDDINGYKYAIGSKNVDVRPVGKQLNQLFNGRGGGSAELNQGSASGKMDDLEQFIKNQ